MKRYIDIDKAKGLAIILVVIGHVVSGPPYPDDNNWYFVLQRNIYAFHMPFFMYLSGVSFNISYSNFGFNNYSKFVKKKLVRIIIPFLMITVLIIIGKLLFQIANFSIDNPVTNLIHCINVFIKPFESPARFLWYIYVLVIYYLTLPLIIKIFKNRNIIIILFSFSLFVLPKTEYFAIDKAIYHFPFFVFGYITYNYYDSYLSFCNSFFIFFNLIFIFLLLLSNYYTIPKFYIGIVSIFSLHSLVYKIPSDSFRFLNILGENSFIIYLLNTVINGSSKFALNLLIDWDGKNFLIYFIILTSSSLLLPIFLKSRFIYKSSFLKLFF